MAESSGFFRSVSGDRKYTVDFLARWVASIIGNGVYDGTLAVTPGDHMQVIIPDGKAWINGYNYRNDGGLTLAIGNADGVLHRKDTVVLRWDVNERSITARVLQGTPASNPIAPAIVRTAEQYDLKIAEISIPAGTTDITQALITDTRLDNNVCGIVHGVVQQADTTALYNQIQSDLAHFRSVNEADFAAWVESLKDILDEETAGNLLNLINDHKADARVHIAQLSCATTGTVHALTGLTATSGIVSCVFRADVDYAAGDTFTVGGAAYSVQTGNGAALAAGAFKANAIVPIELDVDNHALHIETSTPSGALPLSGGTMTGPINFSMNGKTYQAVNIWDADGYGIYVTVGGSQTTVIRAGETNNDILAAIGSATNGGAASETVYLIADSTIELWTNVNNGITNKKVVKVDTAGNMYLIDGTKKVYSQDNAHISPSTPSGGSDGDTWDQY